MRKAMMAMLVVTGLLALTACGKNYSNGERVGVVTKLSEKGLIFKSFEGEALMALPADVSALQAEKLFFTVDPSAVEKVRAAMVSGKRVSLVYRQWWMRPPTIDHRHVVVDVK